MDLCLSIETTETHLKLTTENTASSRKREATWQRLLRLMEEEHPYLNSKLVQQDIARDLHISNRTLSRVMREKAGTNFNTFVNHYRDRKARKLMEDPSLDHLSLEALAQMAGFNSRAVFYRCFKNLEKESPAQYRARHD